MILKRFSIAEKLKERSGRLRRDAVVVWYAARDPGMPALPKILVVLALGYALSPIDLIPDFIPVLGYLDDVLLVPALLSLAIRLIPDDLMKRAREKAETEPVTLSRNWLVAGIIIGIWSVLVTVLLISILRLVTK